LGSFVGGIRAHHQNSEGNQWALLELTGR